MPTTVEQMLQDLGDDSSQPTSVIDQMMTDIDVPAHDPSSNADQMMAGIDSPEPLETAESITEEYQQQFPAVNRRLTGERRASELADIATRQDQRPFPQQRQETFNADIIGNLPGGRPIVRNPDGSVSTHRNFIANYDDLHEGRFTLIPTMFGGRQVSEDEAAKTVIQNKGIDPDTGEQLPSFNTLQEAQGYEARLHKELETQTDPYMRRRRERLERHRLRKQQLAEISQRQDQPPFPGQRKKAKDNRKPGPFVTPEERLQAPLTTKAARSFAAGIGGLESTTGTVLKYLGADEVGARIKGIGEERVARYQVPRTKEFTWRSLYDPEFYAVNMTETLPISLSLLPLAVVGAYAGAGTATAVGLGAFGRWVLASLGGAALSRPVESAFEAAQQYDAAIGKGATEEEATRQAEQVFKENLALGGMDATQIGLALMPIKGGGSAVRRAVKTTALLVGQPATEAMEEGVQEIIQRRASGEPIAFDPQMQEALASGFIIGAGMGSAATLYHYTMDRVVSNMQPEQKGAFYARMQARIDSGIPESVAVLQSLDEFASTEPGKSVIQEAVAEVKTEAEKADAESAEQTDETAEAQKRYEGTPMLGIGGQIPQPPAEAPAEPQQLPEPKQRGQTPSVAERPSVIELPETKPVEIVSRPRIEQEKREVGAQLPGSKVRDDKGKLIRVFHGTPEVFNEFDINEARGGDLGEGIYLTPEPEMAGGYATLPERGQPNIRPAYVDIRNPLDPTRPLTDVEFNLIVAAARSVFPALGDDIANASTRDLREVIGIIQDVGPRTNEVLSKAGFDGIIELGVGREAAQLVVFKPEQIIPSFQIDAQERAAIERGGGVVPSETGREAFGLPPQPPGSLPEEGVFSQPVPAKEQEAAREPEREAIRAEVAPEPTPAQSEAGNYKKAHLTWQGLDITIETAKGGVRRAADRSWEVADFPADYGYIRSFRGERTEGADGDHVDIYLGEATDSDLVWVIDQVDADTQKFDEHKVMLGFQSEDEALDTYRQGFSDGRADDRIGSVTEMQISEFRAWLEDGDTTKPVVEKGEATPPQAQKQAMDNIPPKSGNIVHTPPRPSGPSGEEEPDVSAYLGPFDTKRQALNARLKRKLSKTHEVAETARGYFVQKKGAAPRAELESSLGKSQVTIPPTERATPPEQKPLIPPTYEEGVLLGQAVRDFLTGVEQGTFDPQTDLHIDSELTEQVAEGRKLKGRLAQRMRELREPKSKDQFAVHKALQEELDRLDRFVRGEGVTTPPEGSTFPVKEVSDARRPELPTTGRRERPARAVPHGESPLAGVSPEDVQGTGTERGPGTSPAERPEPDSGRRTRTDDGGSTAPRSVGGREGEVHTATERGRRAEPGGEQRTGRPGRDYRITSPDELIPGGAKARFNKNVTAINLLKKLETGDKLATPAQQKILAQYTGWGAIPQAFERYREDWRQEADTLKELLTEEEYKAARASTPNAHFTPYEVVSGVWAAAKRLGFGGGRILEPSMGVGNFFGILPKALRSGSQLVGVELDPISGRIAKQLYQTADVRIQGYETVKLPDNFFDLAVSNVPFGDYKLHDPAYNKLSFPIHNYFFAKSLDKVRPGGVVAFITSRYTMDAKNPRVRHYLASKADLVGAIRLPNNAFAKNAGTEVTTDIIFLQKREPGQAAAGPSFRNLADVDGISVNEYFAANPNMMLGEMKREGTMYRGGEPALIAPDGQDLASELGKAVKRLKPNVMKKAEHQATERPTVDDMAPAPDTLKAYAFTEKDGKLYQNIDGKLKPLKVPEKTGERIKGMIGVRDAARDLLHHELKGSSAAIIAKAREHLNKVYDQFIKQHQFISGPGHANEKAFRSDPDLPLLLSLENFNTETGQAAKSDIFTKSTISPPKQVASADTPQDALLITLNETGQVDWERISQLTGKSVTDLQSDLTGEVYLNPEGNWEVADKYLSGDVRVKLRAAQAAAEIDSAYAKNVEALQSVQPEDIPVQDIDVKLGAGWVPEGVVSQFIAELLEVRPSVLSLKYLEPLAIWKLDYFGSTDTVPIRERWGIPERSAVDLLSDALNLRNPTIYEWTDDDTKVVNTEKTLAAREKLRAIKDRFRDWTWENEERGNELGQLYNERFNAIRLPSYDGSHLELPGLTPNTVPRDYQKDAIWRIVQEGNALLAHVVGAGKTFEMIAAAMELRRLGIANKPMIVVPNHLIGQWQGEFMKFYPAAKVLSFGAKDFTPQKRKVYMHRIATGDWDAVIVPQTSFGKIPMADETFNAFLNEQIQVLANFIEEEGGTGAKSSTVKELEAAKKRLEGKLRARRKEETKDTGSIEFEQLGVDALFVDESHYAKRLFFATKMGRVAGLGTGDAARAFDLYAKTRFINNRNGGRGTVFATGTPISNTMAEMYTIQRYLQPDLLREKGLEHFDAWANAFGEVVERAELAAAGKGYKTRQRFAQFRNIPDLLQMFRSVADVQTAEMLNLPVPTISGGKPEIVAVPASAELKTYVDELLERAAAIQGGQVDPKDDNMLAITNDGRLAALDIRLRIEGAEEPTLTKTKVMVERAVNIWKQTAKDRLTQLIFLDLSTPTAGKGGFTVYGDVIKKLTEAGVAREDIAVIHQADTDAKKVKLFEQMNSGEKRILLGSTAKMGEGMNVQTRLVALHHLDAPWRPSDIEQREGRILRPGNMNPEVNVYRYVTEESFDAYMWQTLETKARFINQVMRGGTTMRTAEDVDDAGLKNFAEAKAAASGDSRILDKFDIDRNVSRLASLKQSFENSKSRQRSRLIRLPDKIVTAERTLAQLQVDKADWGRFLERDDFTITIGGTTYSEKDEAGQALVELSEGNKGQSVTIRTPLGGFAGFDFTMIGGGRIGGDDLSPDFMLHGNAFISRFQVAGSASGAIQRLYNAASRVGADVVRQEQTISALQQDQADLAQEVESPFEFNSELEEALSKQKELDDALGINKEESEQVGRESPSEDEDADIDIEPDDGEAYDSPQPPDTLASEPATKKRIPGMDALYTFAASAGQSAELKKLFRDTIRMVHPDVGNQNDTGELARRSEFTRAAISAFQAFDDVRLHDIADRFRKGETSPFASGTKAPQPGAQPEQPGPQPGQNGAQAGPQPGQNGQPPPPEPPESGPASPRYTPPDVRGRRDQVRLDKMIERLQGVVTAPIRTGKFRGRVRRSVKGFYRSHDNTIRTRMANDIGVITHEIGHFISHHLWDSTGRDQFYTAHRAELDQLSQAHARPTPEEGFAELIKWMATDQAYLQSAAPGVHAALEPLLSSEYPEILSILNETNSKYHIWTSEMTLEERLEGHIVRNPKTGGLPLKEQMSALYTGLFDDLHPIAEAVSAMANGRQLPTSENAELLARTYRGWAPKVAEMFLFEGAVAFDTRQTIGPGLSEILQPVADNWQRFEHYGVFRRLQELKGRGDERAQNSINAIGTVLEMEKDANDVFTLSDVGRDVAGLEAEFPSFRAAFDGLQSWNNAMLNYLEASGNLSAEGKQVIADLNQSYFPFYRFMSDQSGGKATGAGVVDVPKGVKTLKGSGRAFLSPLEGLVKNAYTMTSIAERNDVGRQLANLADLGGDAAGIWMERIPAPFKITKIKLDQIRQDIEDAGFDLSDGDLETVATVFGRDKFAKVPGEVVVLRDGQPTRYQVPERLYKALLAVDRSELNFVRAFLQRAEHINPAIAKVLSTILTGPPRMLRAGATLAPEFQLRNPARDIPSRAMFTGEKAKDIPADIAKAVPDFIKGVFSVLQADKYHRAFERGGAGISALSAIDRQSLQKKLGAVLKGSPGDVTLTNPISWLRWMSQLGENANRVAEVRRNLQRMGVTDPATATKDQLLQAGYAGRDVVVDFNRHGAWTGGISSLASFWNAGLQGMEKTYRFAKQNPKRFFTFGVVAITLPSLLLWLAQHDDERYQEEPQWKKDISWIIYPDIIFPGAGYPKDIALRIPKPWELGIIFGSIPERIADWLVGQGWDPMTTLGGMVGKMFLPIPTTLQPLVENFANYSLFFNRPIEPGREDRLLPAERHGPGTSEVAKAAGKFFGLSPRKIDNVLRSYTGGLGRLSNDVIDAIVRRLSDAPEARSRGIAGWPMIRGVVSRYPSLQSESIARFYNEWERAQQTWNSAKEIQKRNPGNLKPFLEAHFPNVSNYPLLSAAAALMSEHRSNIRLIEKADAPAEKKREKIDQEVLVMIGIARNALSVMREADTRN